MLSESIDEVENVGNDFGIIHALHHVPVPDTFVELVVLDHSADGVSRDFILRGRARSVVLADKETDRDILNETHVIEFSCFLTGIKGIERPVVGRIPLESTFLCVLGVVVERAHRDAGQC